MLQSLSPRNSAEHQTRVKSLRLRTGIYRQNREGKVENLRSFHLLCRPHLFGRQENHLERRPLHAVVHSAIQLVRLTPGDRFFELAACIAAKGPSGSRVEPVATSEGGAQTICSALL